MAKAKGGPHRVTLAERAAHLERHPEDDTRPRYTGGTPVEPEDVVEHGGREGRLLWCNRVQDVPAPVWEAVEEGVGTEALPQVTLTSRRPPVDACRAERCWC